MARRGDPTESGTENTPPMVRAGNGDADTGKGEKVR